MPLQLLAHQVSFSLLRSKFFGSVTVAAWSGIGAVATSGGSLRWVALGVAWSDIRTTAAAGRSSHCVALHSTVFTFGAT